MIVFSKPLEIIKSTHPCFEGAHKSLWSDYCPLVRFVASHCCWQGGDDDDESEDRKIATEEEKEWRERVERNFSKIVCGHYQVTRRARVLLIEIVGKDHNM